MKKDIYKPASTKPQFRGLEDAIADQFVSSFSGFFPQSGLISSTISRNFSIFTPVSLEKFCGCIDIAILLSKDSIEAAKKAEVSDP